MKKLIKNKKLLFGIIIGLVLGVSITGVVAYSVYANKVTYDNTQSGLQSTDVQGAIDELYTKADNLKVPTAIYPANAPGGTVFAISNGTKGYVCNTNINGKTLCVQNGIANNTDDFNTRKTALQAACTAVGGSFYDSSFGSSDTDSFFARCYDSSSDFHCSADSSGRANCDDFSSNHGCYVYAGGSVYCY